MNKNKKNSNVINFGCRLNTYESEVIKLLVKKNNIKNTLIFNTCAVTKEAERQAQQAIRKYKKENPKMDIVVTGCASQINPNKFKEMEQVDFVIGNNEKIKNKTWKNLDTIRDSKISNIMEIKEINHNIVKRFNGSARAYVEIQQGCNHRCTFCIIPYGRGNNRSIPMGLIVKRVKKLVSNGYNEIVLTGVDITDYGLDLPGQPSLAQMVKRLLKIVTELKQLRLSSIDCSEINEDFWNLLKSEKRLMPHLLISLQAGDDLILKRMKRRHNRSQALEFCYKAKKIRPNIVLGADLIAGFPTENDEMFNNTCSLIKECDLTYLHVFPYSQREDTPASKMPQVPNQIKKFRANLLRQIGKEQLNKYLKNSVGKEMKVLIEKKYENYSIGRTQEYAPIKINKELEEGKLFTVKVKDENNNFLIA